MTHAAALPIKRLAVYCGSTTPGEPAFTEAARNVGRQLAERGIGIVYGGGRIGLMGALADSALQAGGEVIGVIPEALVGKEVAHHGCTELHTVANMHARKAKFTDLSDGFLTMPGGNGTMDELWEAVSWSQLGYHDKPVGLLNVAGFFDHLIAFNRHMHETGMVRPQHKGIILVAETLDELLAKMGDYRPHPTIYAMQAKDL